MGRSSPTASVPSGEPSRPPEALAALAAAATAAAANRLSSDETTINASGFLVGTSQATAAVLALYSTRTETKVTVAAMPGPNTSSITKVSTGVPSVPKQDTQK